MTESVRGYLLSVVAVALLSGIVLALAPKGAVHRTLTFLCGLSIILASLGPLAGLDFDTMAQALARTRVEAEAAAEGVTVDNEELIADIIKEETEAYIWDKAAGLGLTLSRVEVEVETGDAYPYPYGVTIAGSCTEAQKAAMTRLLEQELAIPSARQEWSTYESE